MENEAWFRDLLVIPLHSYWAGVIVPKYDWFLSCCYFQTQLFAGDRIVMSGKSWKQASLAVDQEIRPMTWDEDIYSLFTVTYIHYNTIIHESVLFTILSYACCPGVPVTTQPFELGLEKNHWTIATSNNVGSPYFTIGQLWDLNK